MKVKTNLVAGFLGSGKTTLLRHFLSSPALSEKVAVLVNEVGEVGIDGAILKRASGSVLELANGCICCQISGDLVDAMRKLAADFAPDRILIESTGIAEPGKVLAALYGPLADAVRVEPTVVVVDAAAFDRLYEDVAYHYVMQIKSADLILLNKLDLLGKARLAAVKKKVAALNPRAFILPTEHCRVDLLGLMEGTLTPTRRALRARLRTTKQDGRKVDTRKRAREFSLKSPRPSGERVPEGGVRGARRSHKTFASAAFTDLGRLNQAKLERFLERLPREVFRVKGFVELPEGPRLLNWVRGQADWEPWPDAPSDALVFIGSRLDRASLRRGLKAARLNS